MRLPVTELTSPEKDKIKEWILASSDKTVVRKMQDENETSPIAYLYGDRISTFRETAEGFKWYVANRKLHVMDLITLYQRGGYQESAANSDKEDYFGNKRQRKATWSDGHLNYWRGLIEAQTGFFGLLREEYEALQTTATNQASNGRQNEYGRIQSSRPLGELSRCSFEVFLALRDQAFEDDGRLLSRPKREQSTAQASAASTHAARVAPAPPAESWAQDAAARASQTELLGRLNAGLELAAHQSTQIDQLIASLSEKQTAHKATLADLQELQKQIAASQEKGGRA